MDCNLRSPLHWDWESFIMSNPSKTDNHRNNEWEIEKGEGIESIVPNFSGFERVGSGSATSFCHADVPKSSQSTSTNSSSPKEKRCKLASEGSPGESCSNVGFVQVKEASTALEVSVASAESDLCLKLGKRTYSEEIWGRNNNDILTPSVVAGKKSKSFGQGMQIPRCQIDGCELDLSSAKDYHRKHRVCESHSKCPKVIVGGLERRFCQQCSRLHAVSEFDETKRSCRKRLTHHNARRRKQQGVFPLNPERVYNRRQHTNMLWNGLSFNARSEEKYAWGTPYDTKPRQTESGFTLSFQSCNGSEEQLVASSNSSSFSAFQTASGFSAGKSNLQLPGKGVGEYSGVLHETQDFHRALSLLSTSSNPLVQPHVQPLSSLFFSYESVPK